MSVNKYTRRNRDRRDSDHDILGVVLIIVSVFLLLCTIIPVIFGVVSELLKNVILGVFGVSTYAILAAMLATGIVLVLHRKINVSGGKIALVLCFLFSLFCLLQLATTHAWLAEGFVDYLGHVYDAKYTAGGVVFGTISYVIQLPLSPVFAYIFFGFLMLLFAVLLGLSFYKKSAKKEKQTEDVRGDRKINFTDNVPAQRVFMHNPTQLFVENIVPKEAQTEHPQEEEFSQNAASDLDLPQDRKIDSGLALHMLYDTNAESKKVTEFDRQFLKSQDDKNHFPSDYYHPQGGFSSGSFAPPSVSAMPDIHRAEETNVFPRPSRILHENESRIEGAKLPNVVIPQQKESGNYDNPGIIMNSDRAMRDGIISDGASTQGFYNSFKSYSSSADRPTSDAPTFGIFRADSIKHSEPEKKEEKNPAPIINASMLASMRTEQTKPEQQKPPVTPPTARTEPKRNPIANASSLSFESRRAEERTEKSEQSPVRPTNPIFGMSSMKEKSEPEKKEESPIRQTVKTEDKHLPVFDSFSSASDFSDKPTDEPSTPSVQIENRPTESSLQKEEPMPSAYQSDSFIIDDNVIDMSETDKDFGEDNSGYYVSTENKEKLEKQQKILPGQMDMSSLPKTDPDAVALPQPPKPYHYTPPPLSLLENRTGDIVIDENDIEEKSHEIEEVLASMKFPAKVVNVISGPTVTRYELQPQAGTSVRKILSLDKDLEYQLARGSVRIEAPVANKQAIGIEVASSHPAIVGFREIVESTSFADTRYALPLALGKDIGGDAIVRNLEKMPHLLVAGTTGTGKSVCLNTLIMSILYKCSPEDVRIILVDPKQVEFTLYREMPHLLLRNPITNVDHAVNALEWLIDEMNRRFDIFNNVSLKGYAVRNLSEYNACKLVTDGKAMKMPYIIMIVDELADLMSVRKKDIENKIRIITQKSRAAGIHLILATQRPSVDIITGTIKVNLPSRIAFKVTSFNDSRTILDQGGAESLLGNGDMLLMSNTEPMRLQGAYVSNEEIVSVVEYIKSHNEAIFDENIESTILSVKEQPADAPVMDVGEENPDEQMYPDIMRSLIVNGTASTSMVQRRFQLGYSRASRILDAFEMRKWVGPSAGAKPREVYMTESQYEEIFGKPFNE